MAKRSANRTKTEVKNATYGNPIQDWLRDVLADRESKNDTGVTVNGKTALGYPPVWSCINKIAGHVGYLPIHLYERSARDTKQTQMLLGNISYYAIACEPNAFMTPSTFKETITGDAILHGNGRAYIVRDGNNVASEFLPLPPDKTSTFMVKFTSESEFKEGGMAEVTADPGGWEKWHVTRLTDGSKFYFPDFKVLHIAGMGYDGVQGYSVLELAKTSIGLGLAGEKAAAKNFKTGARPSFMLKAPNGVLTKESDAREFLKQFREEHEGVDNEGKIGLLRGGIELETVQHTAQESQWNEQRLFQRQEMALLFAVEQILGDDSSVSYRSLEEKNRAYITNCLNRWLNKWEQELFRKTLTTSQRRSMRFYYRFDDWELTRGTMSERFQAYQIARQAEILSANECREFEDLEPRSGGDSYANPAINPQTPSGPVSTGQDATQKQNTSARAAIESHVSHIVGVEKKRILGYAENASRFVTLIDRFYSGWGDRIEKMVCELGGDKSLAIEWVEESKAMLIEASGRATKETIVAEISRTLEAWGKREKQLIDSIFEVTCA